MSKLIAVLLAMLTAALLSACGEDSTDEGQNIDTAPEQIALEVTKPQGDTTDGSEISVAGNVTEGSTVLVNGDEAEVSGGRFEARVPLDVGSNTIDVEAMQEGFESASQTVTITREMSAPEPEPDPLSDPAPDPEPEPSASCHPSYEGACLDPNASDYDCEGGSGDGPEYTATVTVVGDDPYDLDRDGDGTACDS